jgi:hypothetical protein
LWKLKSPKELVFPRASPLFVTNLSRQLTKPKLCSLLFQEQIDDNPHPEDLIEIDESTPICTH